MPEKKTNDQIALELAQKGCNIQGQICSRHVGAMAMAEYKDEQFRQAIIKRYRHATTQREQDILEVLYKDVFDACIVEDMLK